MFAITLISVGLSGLAPQSNQAFDPTGDWTVSTTTDTGQALSVAVQISGKPGAYTGQAQTPDRVLQLRDLATTPTGMIAIFDLPQGAIVVRIVREPADTYSGAWGEVTQTYALTATRKGK
jgi:hypothetical protein